jgi:RIO-like serine/threonine protein kinase
MVQLTHEQWRVLTFVQHYMSKWHIAPKANEVWSHCGLPSSHETHEILEDLQFLGLVHLRFAPRTESGKRVRRVIPTVTVCIGVEP